MTTCTDRSKVIAFQTCPRKRFLAYHLNGMGIQKDALNSNLFIGSCVHFGLAILLYAVQECDHKLEAIYQHNYVEVVVEETLKFFDEGIQKSPFDDEEDENFLYFEYRSLVEATIRVYALVGLPELLREYEVLEVEKELEFWLTEFNHKQGCEREHRESIYACTCGGDDGILFLSRPDAVLRRRSDGAIVVLSYKTSATYDAKLNELQNKYDMQGISETVAVERWLDTQITQDNAKTEEEYLYKSMAPSSKVAGVKMEFLIKGSKVGQGQYKGQINNFLIHPYQNDNTGELTPLYEWKNELGETKRLGKGWRKVNIWELGDEALQDWIELLREEYYQLLKSLVVMPEIYYRNEDQISDWLEQTIAQEVKIQRSLESQPDDTKSKEWISWLNQNFFQTRGSCFSYNHKCWAWEACWLGLSLECADFIPRVPNHPRELELIQLSSDLS